MEKLLPFYVNTRRADGYNKPVVCIPSPRSCGKTTLLWKHFVYNNCYIHKKGMFVYLVRNVNAVNELLQVTISKTINKFTRARVRVSFKKRDKDNFAFVLINGKMVGLIISLKINSDQLKNINIGKVAYMFLDEFSVNERRGNKYVSGEAFKVKELWSTLSREYKNMRFYLFGNLYSLYSPYFSAFGINEKKLKIGEVTTSKDMVVDFFKPSHELMKILKDQNKLLDDEDDVYTQFALLGKQVNDDNIIIVPHQPQNFTLKVSFRVEGQTISCYRGADFKHPLPYSFWVGKNNIDDGVVCLSPTDLVDGSVLFSSSMRIKLVDVEGAFAHHKMAFQSIEVERIFEEVFKLL